MRMENVLYVLILSLTVVPASNLQAQTTSSGGLSGVVVDSSHAVVPDADVEIADTAKGTTQSTKTDHEGVYRFFFLAPGKYTLSVKHPGFRQERRTVAVLLGPTVSVNVTLTIGTANSSITVTDEAPLIQAENGDVSTTMNQSQVSEVPNPGNDLTYIVQTAPGVVMNTDTFAAISEGKFSILGMPGTSYRSTIDGVNDSVNAGALGLVLGQNQVQETTVVSTGYSGQFGGAAGGNINYVTKAGDNTFHGNAQYYWNGRVLNANDWFDNALGNPRPFSNANQWAGSFGGPIHKDKLFFFFDTEGLRLIIPTGFAVAIPSPEFEAATIVNIDSRFGPTSASDAFYKQMFNLYNSTPGADTATPGGFADSLGCTGFHGPNGLGTTVPCARHFFKTRGIPSQDTLTSGRLDWNLGQSDRAFFRIVREDGFGAFYVNDISPLFDGIADSSQWQGQFVETHTFGPLAASQFLVAASDWKTLYHVRNPSQALAAFPTVLHMWVPGTFTDLGGVNWIWANGCDCTHFQISEDVVKTRGRHKVGVGLNFNRGYWHSTPDKDNVVGQLYPQTLQAFYQGGVDPANPEVDYTVLTQAFNSQTGPTTGVGSFEVYAQDEWHARPNLTITLALRAEHHSNVWCKEHCFARPVAPFESMRHDPNQPYNQAILVNQEHSIESVDSINWSPRLGFAWQPFGVSHNSVLRGGAGIFYDPFREDVASSFYTNVPIYNEYTAFANNLTPNETASLFKDTATSNTAFVKGFTAGATLAQLQAEIPNFSPPALSSAERRMPSPQYQRWSLEWQQVFGVHTSASVGYFGHHGIHELVVNPSANAFGFGSLPAGPCTSPPIPPCSDPRFGQVTQYGSHAISNYNGMVASFRHQFTRWGFGLVQVNYTFGHALDEVSNGGVSSFTQGSSIYPQDPRDLRGAYGAAEYDVRHSLNGNYVWELPMKAALGGHGPDLLVRGWQVSGTVFLRTGFPYTVLDVAESGNLQRNNYFGKIYSVPVGPHSEPSACGKAATFVLNLHPCWPPQFFVLEDGTTVSNPNALFVQSECETGFNTGHLPARTGPCDGPLVSFAQGRNHFRYPSYFNADFAIAKSTQIPGWESATLKIGFQFFNLFNHPNFGGPDNWTSSPTFGQIFLLEQTPTSILGSGIAYAITAQRMIQLKAELRF